MSLGERYMERLNDGRKVWLGEQSVDRIARHPAFAATARLIASMLDRQEEPGTMDLLTYKVEDKQRAHMAFLVPESKEDLFRRHQAFRFDPDETFGMADGPSQYIRSVLTGHYAARHDSGLGSEYASKLEAYYKHVRDRDLICAAASGDPQSRAATAGETGPGLRIVRETKEGIIVSGARMAATNAPYADEILVSFHDPGSRFSRRTDSPMFAVSTCTPGLHIVCRESIRSGERDDAPVSARFAEMDAVLVFDEVLVSWDRVFVKNDPEALHRLWRSPAGSALGRHQAVVRLFGHLEFIAAVGHALVSASETKTLLHIQEKMGELMIQLETLKGLLVAAEHPSRPSYDRVWLPDEQPLRTACSLGARFYPRAIEIVRQIGADSLLQRPARLADFGGPVGHFLREYYGGTDRDAFSRTKLVKLAWDLVGSPLAARRTLYEQFLWGDPVQGYADHYETYPIETLTEPVWRLVHANSKPS
ncbi:4-hydroxyphenylacetate 3-hydroxylase N-terminal domain-containing protein [Paenibacillus hamazuiensis]|uniref:4-hydroxyphenylacetate 3-hydroxylase N-terminal domain-containing protein n=1 Tax=Paenibacillus hamazuiensis TaxID=2936508 RepID=UPI00200BB5D3|nr:4-hydroxyphenylacetate 3-hydroxylase N-terminal domain-containing protein [Paenibacillus hamazuiensis]